jgi:hypothetical protein
MFCLWQLFTAVIQEDKVIKDLPLNTLCNFLICSLAEDHTAKEARTALGLPRDYPANKHSVLATLLHQYKSL